MTHPNLNEGLQLQSLATKDGELRLSLVRVPVAEPAAGEIVVRIEAAPINPSDLGLLLGPADLSTAKATSGKDGPVVTAKIPEAALPWIAARLDQSLPVGNEGAGIVVKAGSSPEAQALLGKAVAIIGGATYAQYRTVKAADVLVLPPGATPEDGASCFVNPLTALGMVETMRREGHTALIHTAAASNLGQMLNRICINEGIGLVNVVRSAAQAKILRELGAKHVVDSSSPDFYAELGNAVSETGATLAFDAIGGGKLAGQLLTAMEAAAVKRMTTYNRYGSTTHKQVYIYGGLDTGPTILNRSFGMAWGIGGWLLTPFLIKIGPAEGKKLRDRVAAELKTTFASKYTKTISLAEALNLETLAAYAKRATGEKYLINPNA